MKNISMGKKYSTHASPEADDSASLLLACSETLIATLALPIAGYWLRPLDPLFLHTDFPWLVLIPLVIGLRYGFFYGFSSALITVALIGIASNLYYPQPALFPTEITISILLVGMISGEFRDHWNRQQRALKSSYQSQKLRLNEFTRSYHLLKTSHAALENQLAGRTTSLRLLLMQVRRQMLDLKVKTTEPLGGIGSDVLRLFSTNCKVRMAAIYSTAKGSKSVSSAVACLGNPPPVSITNRLIVEALREGRTVCLKQNDHSINDDVLVVVPLRDVTERIWGLVVVHDMPLSAFQQDNLALMTIIGGYFGDLLMRWINFHDQELTVAQTFRLNLQRSLNDLRSCRVHTSIAVMIFGSTQSKSEIIDMAVTHSRCLDLNWMRQNHLGHLVLFKLMPLTNEADAKEMMRRLETELHNMTGLRLLELGVTVYIKELAKEDTVEETITQLEVLSQIVTEEIAHATTRSILQLYGT